MRWISTLLFVLTISFVFAHKHDSIGTKVKDGKVYILHKVEKGDGMYGISKRYNVKLSDLVNENPGSAEVIKIGEVLLVPTTRDASAEETVVKKYFNNTGKVRKSPKPYTSKAGEVKEVTTFAKYHTVKKGETLYSIAKQYNTKPELIMSLNGLESTTLRLDQKLLVQDGKAEIKEVKEVSAEDNKPEDATKYEDLGFKSNVETKTQKDDAGFVRRVEKLVDYNIDKVEEEGKAEIEMGKLPSDKNYALHFDAPKGTVIMVTNKANQKTIFVKVNDTFKRNDSNPVIIKLSEKAAKQIGLEDHGEVLLSYAR
jgi:LysM repeat protein